MKPKRAYGAPVNLGVRLYKMIDPKNGGVTITLTADEALVLF
jgi:hypothetical protein